MSDGGKLNGGANDLSGFLMGPNDDHLETQVWQSPGIAEVARRLGMLALEENTSFLV